MELIFDKPENLFFRKTFDFCEFVAVGFEKQLLSIISVQKVIFVGLHLVLMFNRD